MCYSPIRYAWDLQHQYLRESNLDKGIKGWVAKWFLHKMRIWDTRTANGVDKFIAISNYIGRRIDKVYKRSSTTIYPPVYVNDFIINEPTKEEFYFTSSRMVPYKRIDLIVETFTKVLPHKKLIVIGDGPEFKKIKSLSGDNVTLMGYQSFDVLKEHLAKAKAFIFAAEEDFGIAPLEAQAAGTPVIAFGKGGALETVQGLDSPTPSGIFFEYQTIESLRLAIEEFEGKLCEITSDNCITNSQRFSDERFRLEFKSFIDNTYNKWRNNL